MIRDGVCVGGGLEVANVCVSCMQIVLVETPLLLELAGGGKSFAIRALTPGIGSPTWKQINSLEYHSVSLVVGDD